MRLDGNIRNLVVDHVKIVREPVETLPLRGNQWVPLGIKSTLQNRISTCAVFDDYCNGGSICHINVDNQFANDDMAWDMLNYTIKKGVKYFAFNPKISVCEDGHAFYGDVCPICGKYKSAEFTRTVGFFTMMAVYDENKNRSGIWAKSRDAEGQLREWHDMSESIN